MRPGEASVPVHLRPDRQSVRAEQGDARGPMAVGSRDVADERRGLGEAPSPSRTVRQVKPSLWNGRAPSLSAASTPKTSESTWAGVSGTGG